MFTTTPASRRAVIAAAVFGLISRRAGAEPVTTAARDIGRHWPAGKVITVENRLGRKWHKAVEHVVDGWNGLTPPVRLRVVNRPNAKGCPPRKGRIMLCRDRNAGVIIRSERKRIHSATIKMEPGPARGRTWSPGVSRHDVTILCQSVGLALGLDFVNNKKSVMDPDTTRTQPGPFDRRSLKRLYTKRR